MLVKICGLSNRIDTLSAVESGADALGFVMGGKVLPIEVEPPAQLVREWIQSLPKSVETLIVTHLAKIEDILDLSDYVNSSGIQVSESLPPEQLRRLRDRTDKTIIKTIPVFGEQSLDYLKAVEPYADFLLLDSVSEGYVGGTGITSDWNLCAKLIREASKPVYLAGGLTPENLNQAIEVTSPDGVDVSTGISTYSDHYLKKDRKDPYRIDQFITLAKKESHHVSRV